MADVTIATPVATPVATPQPPVSGAPKGRRDVVVLSAVRTAIGKYGGGLKEVPPAELAATVVRAAVAKAGVAPAEVGHLVFGNVIHTEGRDMYLSRVAAINGGCRSRPRR